MSLFPFAGELQGRALPDRWPSILSSSQSGSLPVRALQQWLVLTSSPELLTPPSQPALLLFVALTFFLIYLLPVSLMFNVGLEPMTSRSRIGVLY